MHNKYAYLYKGQKRKKSTSELFACLPNGERTESTSYRYTVDNYVINRKDIFAFDREHDTTVVGSSRDMQTQYIS